MGEKRRKLKRIAVIGPVYPYKGGISHYTGLLVQTLKKKYETVCFSFSLQYPKILFRKEQKEYGNNSFGISDTYFVINTADPFNWRKAAKKIRASQPDLVVLQWWHPYFAPCYQGMLRALKDIPVAFICHNVLPHERFPLDAFLTKGTLKRASFCIVHSGQDREDLGRLLPQMPARRSVHPSYNAFKIKDMSRSEARQMLSLEEDEKVLLFFGLVRKYKGLDILIDAAAGCAARVPKLRILVVGDFGKHKEEYTKRIEESAAADCFVIRDGYVPDAEVEPYFAAADLCVCPYRSATQSGIVQIAFGFGLPVIATAVGGLPEAVTDGRTGYIVPPENPAALSAAIARYFSEGKAAEFASNVWAEEERFSWDRMRETIEEMYGENCQ
ncbi:MAG: glycosyltransferase [Lachnospiraceae bacterium]|nr:glycosyltransferase [Lachnospiraceae bacterium]